MKGNWLNYNKQGSQVKIKFAKVPQGDTVGVI